MERGLDLLRRGYSTGQVAEACGVAVSTAQRWRLRYIEQNVPWAGIEACPVCEGGRLARAPYAELLGV